MYAQYSEKSTHTHERGREREEYKKTKMKNSGIIYLLFIGFLLRNYHQYKY